MNIYYWSPFITPVATVKAVINSADSLNKYSKNEYSSCIINVAGEWDIYKNELTKKNIKFIDLTSYKIIDNKRLSGFFKSRFAYILLFIIAFFPLLRLLKLNPPSYFIVHLISPLPLIINYFFNINTKMILRISGLPKLNLIRTLLWKVTLKKIHFITCPTIATKKDIESKNIISNSKINILYDPIISPKNIRRNLVQKNLLYKNYYLAIGRLTRQKNFIFLIDTFASYNKNKNYKLIIVGEGEQKKLIEDYIKINNLQNSIIIHNFTKNIFNYYKNSKCFVLSSLWEDTGFVLVEACYMNTPIISSNCKNGPEEILNHGKNGLLFDNNNKKSLLEALKRFENLTEKELKQFKINAKKKSKKFTMFNHYKLLIQILKIYE